MQLSIMLEPQEGITFDEQLAVARRAEELNFTGFYRSDHYLSVSGHTDRGSTDAWAVLAALARETGRIRLGTLVSPVTFRPAGNLAKVVATVHELAGTAPDGSSRIDLGMGTGWLEAEHRQHGFPFEELGTRFRRLEEHLAAVTALWDPDITEVDLDGEFVQIAAGRFQPVPRPRPRIVVGGKGLRRTPDLAARYAEELNGVFATPAQCAEQRAALDERCRATGRDPATVAYTLMTGCLVGRTEEAFRERAARAHRFGGGEQPLDEWLDELRGAWVLGTLDAARARLEAFADAGVEEVMLQLQQHDDLDQLDDLAQLLGG